MVAMNNVTPMMQRYLEIKASYPDCIVFYRLGDFYEMFFEDAKEISKAIGLTLTGRSCGLEERAPMCGVPFHSVNVYIKKLVDLGYKIAIAEQMEEASGKGLISRDVVKIITSGTVIDDAMLDESQNNFVMSIYNGGQSAAAVAWCDITTGEFYTAEYENAENAVSQIRPKEIILNKKTEGVKGSEHYEYAFYTKAAKECVCKYFSINSTTVFDIPDNSPLINAAGGLLEYLLITQKGRLSNITKISRIKNNDYLILDKISLDNLEILTSYKDNKKKGSLLHVLDHTKTPMGARLLSAMVASPLRKIADINARQNVIAAILANSSICKDLRDLLSQFNDLARFGGKISNGNVTPRDIIGFANTLKLVKKLKNYICDCNEWRSKPNLLTDTADNLIEMADMAEYLLRAVKPEPPALMADGGYINDGFNTELDELRNAAALGKEWLTRLEAKEKAETGIEKMRLSYNRLVGYFFEVPVSFSKNVPYRFIRKGSTINTERFTTDELRETESKILGAGEKSIALEKRLFGEIIQKLCGYIDVIKNNAECVALIDVLCGLAHLAYVNEWTRPKMNKSGLLKLKNARHPVLENILPKNTFIANDTDLSPENTTMIITGPNMAGKSTYMKTVALNVIMAHIGSFVPCDSAEISITDRVFTRIGASDDMLTGKSTFMVEMNEVSNIVHNATKDSLLLLDEIGRGTGTTDGFALAKAILQYIIKHIGAKTMFATHFHKLVAMAKDHDTIKNYKVLTREINGEIIFLHKVAAGEEPNSFGTEVAKLSGLPAEIIENAKRIMKDDSE
jgi:DNA mismatch repair protein MutS